MHPILLQTNFFTINTLWIFIIAALLTGTSLFIKEAIKNSLKIQFITQHAWQLIIWSIIGARIANIITNYKSYFYSFSGEALIKILYFWDKGFSFWGALIGFTVYLHYICKKNDQDFLSWLDALIPAGIFALSITHIGNFFEGSSYGNETSLPWGVNFESPAIRYTVPIHPTQIYAFLYTLALGFILIYLEKRPKIQSLKKSGFIALAGIASYNGLRFLEEFFRGDDTFLLFDIRVSQIIVGIIAISASIILYLRYNKPKRKIKK
ncbi:hypothetical protein COU74_04170 [Candidatus Peregrinibacteria bacterium CG10_big_fil_rev_8_21_14_0_10_36_19]|nr:MAG: hypothetical protein COU74_04170 [Candidatus Peregrinibacteria bacterium CG10_big_fil_rev_8_21_14_0_10_36_19]